MLMLRPQSSLLFASSRRTPPTQIRMTAAARAGVGSADQPAPAYDPIVQYVVLRADLWKTQGWPCGSIVAQVSTKLSALSLSLSYKNCLFATILTLLQRAVQDKLRSKMTSLSLSQMFKISPCPTPPTYPRPSGALHPDPAARCCANGHAMESHMLNAGMPCIKRSNLDFAGNPPNTSLLRGTRWDDQGS